MRSKVCEMLNSENWVGNDNQVKFHSSQFNNIDNLKNEKWVGIASMKS